MKARMSGVPAEIGPVMRSLAEQGRIAPLRVSDAMCATGKRMTEI